MFFRVLTAVIFFTSPLTASESGKKEKEIEIPSLSPSVQVPNVRTVAPKSVAVLNPAASSSASPLSASSSSSSSSPVNGQVLKGPWGNRGLIQSPDPSSDKGQDNKAPESNEKKIEDTVVVGRPVPKAKSPDENDSFFK